MEVLVSEFTRHYAAPQFKAYLTAVCTEFAGSGSFAVASKPLRRQHVHDSLPDTGIVDEVDSQSIENRILDRPGECAVVQQHTAR
ncbi:hypothetical protein BH20CHL3_BH20CHL3_06240 [soil metagenome]